MVCNGKPNVQVRPKPQRLANCYILVKTTPSHRTLHVSSCRGYFPIRRGSMSQKSWINGLHRRWLTVLEGCRIHGAIGVHQRSQWRGGGGGWESQQALQPGAPHYRGRCLGRHSHNSLQQQAQLQTRNTKKKKQKEILLYYYAHTRRIPGRSSTSSAILATSTTFHPKQYLSLHTHTRLITGKFHASKRLIIQMESTSFPFLATHKIATSNRRTRK